MIVFECLNNWFEKNSSKLSEQNISYSFSELRTDVSKPSQSVDIEKGKKLAQIIL